MGFFYEQCQDCTIPWGCTKSPSCTFDGYLQYDTNRPDYIRKQGREGLASERQTSEDVERTADCLQVKYVN